MCQRGLTDSQPPVQPSLPFIGSGSACMRLWQLPGVGLSSLDITARALINTTAQMPYQAWAKAGLSNHVCQYRGAAYLRDDVELGSAHRVKRVALCILHHNGKVRQGLAGRNPRREAVRHSGPLEDVTLTRFHDAQPAGFAAAQAQRQPLRGELLLLGAVLQADAHLRYVRSKGVQMLG